MKNASLLDMAVVRLGNPCTDLAYFFYISTTPQLRATHLEDMLGHYHDVFVRCLHELGEDPVIYPFRYSSLKTLKDLSCFGISIILSSFLGHGRWTFLQEAMDEDEANERLLPEDSLL